jgi:hypothetical protein
VRVVGIHTGSLISSTVKQSTFQAPRPVATGAAGVVGVSDEDEYLNQAIAASLVDRPAVDLAQAELEAPRASEPSAAISGKATPICVDSQEPSFADKLPSTPGVSVVVYAGESGRRACEDVACSATLLRIRCSVIELHVSPPLLGTWTSSCCAIATSSPRCAFICKISSAS